jgi:anaerobic magnesium-protoporphyrin IX monomethyl ester cyclase
MKVTFVYPGIAMIGFNSLGGPCHDTISINLGLGYISSYLKKNSDHTADLIDLREVQGWDHYVSELVNRNPDVVGIYCNTVNFENSLKAAELAKSLGKQVVMGGPHATLDPESLLKSGFIDSVIVGEGEISFLRLVEDISVGRKPARIILGEKIDDLDDIPFPDRDLYNMNRILGGPGIFPYQSRYVGIIASRGCHYNCAFCQPLEKMIFGRKIRTRSVANIIAEVKSVIEKYDANFIMFECDTLTTNKSWALELCGEMEKIPIAWGAQSRADTLDDELAVAMHAAGCMVLFIGFESGSQRILNLLRKGITPQQSIQAGRICRRNNLLIFANYMLGVPTETVEDLEMTYLLMKEIEPELHSPSYFSPIPGSDLFDYCKDNDLIKTDAYEAYIRNPTLEKIKGIDYRVLDRFRDKMQDCKRSCWTEVYFARHVFLRWFFLLRRGFVLIFVREFAESLPVVVKVPLRFINRVVMKTLSSRVKDEQKYYPGT